MGGNAFHSLHGRAFPRMPPPVYASLKTRLLPRIQDLYENVTVPFEAPEKADYGDLDFLVFGPKLPTENGEPHVPHDQVKAALGAEHCVVMDGPRTSNYAVPVPKGEWASLGLPEEEARCRREAVVEGRDEIDGELFYQVDVHVCADLGEWKNFAFFHAYGDLGMILGLIARNNGYLLSPKGFKIYDAPNPSFQLSNDFDDIMSFWGLSMDAWRAGFPSKSAIFDWVAQTRFFDPNNFKTRGEGFTKVKPERRMYAEFVEYAQSRADPTLALSPTETLARVMQRRGEALDHFGLTGTFNTLARERDERARLKVYFSGGRVRDWASMGEHWKGVKLIMDEVRAECGGDSGVLELLDLQGVDGLRLKVLQARDRLGLLPVDKLPSASDILSESMSRLRVTGDDE
ncbi:hypothetical protein HGRIS_006050 [Hohenbuehelia grisea]|uniref:Uncharacterized protein n=1 Tax=Hohenbuehelia grisea TaxID=104357 RepID=A0ABR3K173_9AGAR